MSTIYLGLMSGTSIDDVDGALVDFKSFPPKLIATHAEPIAESLKQKILNLCNPGSDTIDLLGHVDVELGRLFAQTAQKLMNMANLSANQVMAIGSHGQTIRHRPHATAPFTLQIGDPHIIASHTGITTIADFRRRDMALGGQAAPLAPAFHQYLFRDYKKNYWVLNIGGIANLTFLPAEKNKSIIGFDTGPGNTLLDAWCFRHTGKRFDHEGQWASNGEINKPLLKILKEHAFFKKNFPKSTGREEFNLAWLDQHLSKLNVALKPQDVQATLVELTASTIVEAINNINNNYQKIWVCGGGVNNIYLMRRIANLCAPHEICSTAQHGIAPKWIEATAFAWLARQTMEGKTGNIPSVTGAKQASILGAIIPK